MSLPTIDSCVPEAEALKVTPDEADVFAREIGSLSGIEIRMWEQFGGRSAYQITLGTEGKPHLYFTRPHAHEPAGTAACFEWIRRLCAREDDWSTEILARFRLSFMADANPTGSRRAPVKFWDGTRYPNETFFLWMFGESGEIDGERFPRVGAWDRREVTDPKLLGIAYEQIDEHTYVEPNRDHRSTFFKAYFDLHRREPVDVWLDLHQTEYVGSDRNTHVNLPTNFDDLDADLQTHYQGLGDHIHDRWRAEGATPHDSPRRPYTGNQTQYDFLNAVWSAITPQSLHLVTEVQNNNTRTPVPTQVWLQMAAMDETLRYLDANGASLLEALTRARKIESGS
jgi:hypothetical protein